MEYRRFLLSDYIFFILNKKTSLLKGKIFQKVGE